MITNKKRVLSNVTLHWLGRDTHWEWWPIYDDMIGYECISRSKYVYMNEHDELLGWRSVSKLKIDPLYGAMILIIEGWANEKKTKKEGHIFCIMVTYTTVYDCKKKPSIVISVFLVRLLFEIWAVLKQACRHRWWVLYKIKLT